MTRSINVENVGREIQIIEISTFELLLIVSLLSTYVTFKNTKYISRGIFQTALEVLRCP